MARGGHRATIDGQRKNARAPTAEATLGACFIVRDATGQALGYFYFEEEFGQRSAILIAGSRYSGSLRGKLICEAFGGLIALIRPDWKIGGGLKFKSARFAGPNVADASLAHAL